MSKLDWLAGCDRWEMDTRVFWKRPGTDPKDVQTEVFLFPAAASPEKEGSASNSGRWVHRNLPVYEHHTLEPAS